MNKNISQYKVAMPFIQLYPYISKIFICLIMYNTFYFIQWKGTSKDNDDNKNIFINAYQIFKFTCGNKLVGAQFYIC